MFFPWLASILALGGLAALFLVEVRDFGRGFHRFTGALVSLLLGLGLAGGALHGPVGWMALLACVGWVCLTAWGPISWVRPSLPVPLLLACWAVLSGTAYPPAAPLLELRAWVVPGNTVAAALLLGSVSLAMLLGHWYLVVPGLPIRHLLRMTHSLGLCLLLRVTIGVLSLASSVPKPALGAVSSWEVAGVVGGFFFWQRVGIGQVAPAILACMVERTVRIHSTQSATGLLYVAIVFVLIGEMISRYLYVSMGIPQ